MTKFTTNKKKIKKNKTYFGDFPVGPVVKTLPSHAGGVGSIPGQEAKIPHDTPPKNQDRTEAVL